MVVLAVAMVAGVVAIGIDVTMRAVFIVVSEALDDIDASNTLG